MHSTDFERSKSEIPSQFTLKLRKHLRTKRLEDVRQLGVDRVVDFVFGSGVATQHLIVEFYASGNVILTDGNYEILSLLRTHKYENGPLIAVKQKYPIEMSKQFIPMDQERLQTILSSAENGETLKVTLQKHIDYGPAVVEHCLAISGISPTLKMPDQWDPAKFNDLLRALQEGDEFFTQEKYGNGYIVLAQPELKAASGAVGKGKAGKKAGKAKGKGNGKAEEEMPFPPQQEAEEKKEAQEPEQKVEEKPGEKKETVLYEEFHPFLFEQFKTRKYLEFPTFDKAVDEYYSKIESQRLELEKQKQEHSIEERLEKVRADQSRRIAELQKALMSNEFCARLIEQNVEDVDKAILIIRSYVAASTDWGQLWAIVKEEKKKGNPIANIIHRLKLEQNMITLLLNETDREQTEEEMVAPAYPVDVDISLSAHANARWYYEKKKKSAEKKSKTEAAADQAVKAAERKARSQMQEIKVKATIQQIRKPMWFEKFHWFISTENYIVIAGRDAQQNELLVRRYLRKGDLYVHADIHGAASCLIKNPTGKPIPPATLQQAGTMTVCRSAAWMNKVVTSAYWVHADQVSKTAPTGEYLVTGSFMIRGKKNYLPPNPLIMGFGIMFKVDEYSVGRHVGERAPGRQADDLQTAEKYGLSESLAAAADEEGKKKAPKAKRAEEDAESEEEEDKEREATRVALPGLKVKSEAELAREQKAPAEEPPAASPPAGHKARLSAAERRKLKKAQEKAQQSGEAAVQPEGKESGPSAEAAESASASSSPPAPSSMSSTPKQATAKPAAKMPRGKKGKLKKMKEKYKDQDEEDRQARMMLLQPEGKKELRPAAPAAAKGKAPQKGGAKPKQSPVQAKHAPSPPPVAEEPTKPTEELAPEAEAESKPQEEVKVEGGAEEEHSEGEAGTEVKKEGEKRKGRKEKREEKLREQEEIRKILEEENVALADDASLTEIDSLTGQPHPEDILLYAVPVCAPYQALQTFKFKVKLMPGSQKKGKAARAAMEMFLKSPDATAREKELIKAIPENELVQCIIGDVKVTAPGLTKAINAKKGK